MNQSPQDIHGGNIWMAARKHCLLPEDILDFSAGINPFLKPDGITEHIYDSLKYMSHYPDPDYISLRNDLSGYLDIPAQSILPCNGLSELFYLLPLAFERNKSVIITPTFSEYEQSLKVHKCAICYVETKNHNNFELPLSALYNKIDEGQLVYICNPNNPTATVVPKEALIEIAGICRKKNALLVIDEAFIEFTDNNKALSLANYSIETKHVIVLRSLTKIFAIPGLRIGFCVGSTNNINRLKRFQPPWSINCCAEAAAKICISQSDKIITHTLPHLQKERNYLIENLNRIPGILCTPSFVNFILCSLSPSYTSTELSKLLFTKGTLIRDCSKIRGLNNSFFRIAVKSHEQNRILITQLLEITKNAC